MLTPNNGCVRVGIDLVDVARMARFVTEHRANINRLFTDRELAYCTPKRRCYEHLAARFAVKEAVLKAFGTGLGQGMLWTDVEVVQEATGRPRVLLHGKVANCAEQRGLQDLDISISHTSSMATACAVAIWRQREEGKLTHALSSD